MSKAVLMSIHPKLVELILNGKKTIEVRKTAPKLETPFKVYVYCIKSDKKYKDIWSTAYETPSGNWKNMSGMVVGEFTCSKIDRYVPILFKGQDFYQGYMDEEYQACVSHSELCKYAKGKTVYGWHISDLKVYDQPKELSEFDLAYCRVSNDIACGECPYYDWNSILHSCRKRRLSRPPQSWCYVEEI